jgi:hypothetical protein
VGAHPPDAADGQHIPQAQLLDLGAQSWVGAIELVAGEPSDPTPVNAAPNRHQPRADLPRPRIQRLGRTLPAWRPEFRAYFATGDTSNGPTEAINLLIESPAAPGTASATSTTTDCDNVLPRAQPLAIMAATDQTAPSQVVA